MDYRDSNTHGDHLRDIYRPLCVEPVRTGWFRYVTYSQIDNYHRAGWMIVADFTGTHHGQYALIMWRCDCEDGYEHSH